MNTLTIQAEGKKYEALIAFLATHEIPFEVTAEETKRADVEPETTDLILEARKDKENGELVEVNGENLWKMIK